MHDEREIEAVVAVLRGGATALRNGKNVRAFEAAVAAPSHHGMDDADVDRIGDDVDAFLAPR